MISPSPTDHALTALVVGRFFFFGIFFIFNILGLATLLPYISRDPGGRTNLLVITNTAGRRTFTPRFLLPVKITDPHRRQSIFDPFRIDIIIAAYLQPRAILGYPFNNYR